MRWYRSGDPRFKTCFPDWPGAERGAPEAFFAWCLSRYAHAARRHAGPLGAWVDYAQLPGAVPGHLLSHFGLEADAAQRARMEEKSRYRSKGNTREAFVPDGAVKRAEATKPIREAVTRWL
ncbi:hypothetical protein D7X99_16860 [Corallococcus sp. AB032C]|nr:hypothetical protein D7X99_16860 [Corallococcus sp. AB032C]